MPQAMHVLARDARSPLRLGLLGLLVDRCLFAHVHCALILGLPLRLAALRLDNLCAEPWTPVWRGVDLVVYCLILLRVQLAFRMRRKINLVPAGLATNPCMSRMLLTSWVCSGGDGQDFLLRACRAGPGAL